jgi:hypothetical protein
MLRGLYFLLRTQISPWQVLKKFGKFRNCSTVEVRVRVVLYRFWALKGTHEAKGIIIKRPQDYITFF